MGSRKSNIWKYFSKTEDINGISKKCLICNQIFKPKTSTSSLKRHLASIHKISFHESENTSNEIPLSKEKSEEITNLTKNFIVDSIQPFSIVNNQSFKTLINYFEPNCNIPDRRIFRKKNFRRI